MPTAEVTQVIEHDAIQVIEGVPMAFMTVVARIRDTASADSADLFRVKILKPIAFRGVQIEPVRLTNPGEFQFNTGETVNVGEELEVDLTPVQ